MGFSHSTALPARAARSVHSTCSPLGKRHVDRVDLRVVQQRLVAVMHAQARGEVGEGRGLGLSRVATANRRDRRAPLIAGAMVLRAKFEAPRTPQFKTELVMAKAYNPGR
jgi:hypothetical protein